MENTEQSDKDTLETNSTREYTAETACATAASTSSGGQTSWRKVECKEGLLKIIGAYGMLYEGRGVTHSSSAYHSQMSVGLASL